MQEFKLEEIVLGRGGCFLCFQDVMLGDQAVKLGGYDVKPFLYLCERAMGQEGIGIGEDIVKRASHSLDHAEDGGHAGVFGLAAEDALNGAFRYLYYLHYLD